MLKILKLLLPAVVPSWRFFDVIAPSPRIQYSVTSDLGHSKSTKTEWLEFNPRPRQLGFMQMCRRIVWNPDWNESLFLMSCAERLIETPTHHSEEQILERIIAALNTETRNHPGKLQFRLKIIKKEHLKLNSEIVFYSRPHTLGRL